VHILTEVDDGTLTIGGKRQKIIDTCETEYVCFVDDDDWVSPNYLASLLLALAGKPDCVTFMGVLTTDGESPENFRLSLHYPREAWSKDAQGIHQRTPNHLCPIKIELARSIRYKEVTSYEDFIWSKSIHGVLRSQCHIDDVLYQYRYSKSGSEAAKRGPKLTDTFFNLGEDGLFYDARNKSYSPEQALEIVTDICSDSQSRSFISRYPELFKGIL
jgi:glycosyltransferase involved in cell wall biosynthesis